MATKQPTKKRASKAPRKSASSGGGTPTKPVKKASKRSSSAPTNGAKKKTSKRASSAPRKAAKKRATTSTKKRTSSAPKKRARTAAKKRSSSLTSSEVSRPTTPARPRAKKAASLEETTEPLYRVAPRVPPRPTPPPEPERVASYLESVPQDRAELVAGLFQVARGAAKDLRTLFTQAIALSQQKNDRFGR